MSQTKNIENNTNYFDFYNNLNDFTKTIYYGNVFLRQQLDIYTFRANEFNNEFDTFITKIILFNFNNVDLFSNWNSDKFVHYKYSEFNTKDKINDFFYLSKDVYQHINSFNTNIYNSYAFGNHKYKYAFVQLDNIFLFINGFSK